MSQFLITAGHNGSDLDMSTRRKKDDGLAVRVRSACMNSFAAVSLTPGCGNDPWQDACACVHSIGLMHWFGQIWTYFNTDFNDLVAAIRHIDYKRCAKSPFDSSERSLPRCQRIPDKGHSP